MASGPLLHVPYFCLQGQSGPTTLQFECGVLLCMSNIMAWWSDNPSSMMGSSSQMIIWWPMVKRLVSPKA